MTQRNIINVVGDMENFIHRLLSHAQEDNCTHSVMDLLDEFYDNKNNNKIGVGPQDKLQQPTGQDNNNHLDKGGIIVK